MGRGASPVLLGTVFVCWIDGWKDAGRGDTVGLLLVRGCSSAISFLFGIGLFRFLRARLLIADSEDGRWHQ